MNKKIVIGTRGSQLAVTQTETVAQQIRDANPDTEVVVTRIVTEGDQNWHVQLSNIKDIGIFVKELEDALLKGKIDLAVHSLKDVPTIMPPGLYIGAVGERADPRDVLISKGQKLADLPHGARIGSGSMRRAIQVKASRPDIEVLGIRGNVDTRIRKVTDGEFDGVIGAAAALKRLGWQDSIIEYLPVDDFLPSVGQGALAIEGRVGDEKTAAIMEGINHLPTFQCITAERSFLFALGGGCRAPIAALATIEGSKLYINGLVSNVAGTEILRDSDSGSIEEAKEIGQRLAQKLLDTGAGKFLAELEDYNANG
ncbi:MAG: hydroxymethylbilane synthase [Chloroflexi bacterium]|jgi:hydroxymethylbilane synthase|nr:hydroxymethylbilane synthase [Chloroflexota bacterium]MBT7080636.1 hydroxymethylbilane synthase [Chloroflexota bacterium]MBT7289011.1 hydroxymethylbilane synthase [Chloroflexota bacterium]